MNICQYVFGKTDAKINACIKKQRMFLVKNYAQISFADFSTTKAVFFFKYQLAVELFAVASI